MQRLIEHGAKPTDRQLRTAARAGQLKMVKYLLEAGADPNGAHEAPPIVSAAFRGYYRVVEHLLAQPGIEVDKQDGDGLTALWAAAKNGSMGMVNLLLEAGADPSVKTETQGNPEQMARHKITQYEEIVRRLEKQVASTKPPANQK